MTDVAAPANGLPLGHERRTIQSVDRALDILEVLAAAPDELRLNEIAEATRLNLSTCHHLVSTLVERGYIAQNPRGRAYFLGNRALVLANARSQMIDLARLAMPGLRVLNQATGETVHLDLLRGRELTTVAKLESHHAVRVATDVIGKAHAAHATATGKAILAWLPETELARVIAENGLHRFTEHTITQMNELVEHLRLVRRNGYAMDREEFQLGVVCVGCAIRDHVGAVKGAVSCSMPSMRASEEQILCVLAEVKATATGLSLQLGGEAAENEAAARSPPISSHF